MAMQHPWILPFLPLTSAPIQLTLPHPSQHHHHHTAVHQQVPASTMGLTLQPVMTPSGTLLLPALQQNAAAAVAAFAAAAAAQGSWPSMANSAVMMTNFPRCRLKVFDSRSVCVCVCAVAARYFASFTASSISRVNDNIWTQPLNDAYPMPIFLAVTLAVLRESTSECR